MPATATHWLRASARLDPTGAYRYSLVRAWQTSGPRAAFVLLNPSTADATTDDPTLRRCVGFARRWGFASVEIVNCFALRATDPRELRRARDPVGPRNNAAIRRAAARADLVVAAWGNHASLLERDVAVRSILGRVGSPMTLGLTKRDQPRHPLYAAADTPLTPLA